MTLYALMQDQPLLVSSLIEYAAKYHGTREIVSRTVQGPIHRYTYADAAKRAAKAANALQKMGVKPGDRIATMAWNTFRHFELFYAISGIEAVLHTVNPRLFAEQIEYIVNHAEDHIMFLDADFVPLAEKLCDKLPSITTWIVLADRADMPKTTLSNVLCYEDWIADEDDHIDWPEFDERAACSLCYTSGTTGDPKGVLYGHRSTVIHALVSGLDSAFGLGSKDAVLPIAPMYHANAWAMPYIGALTGAKLVLPGPRMDPEGLLDLINDEGVTFACAVPTVWTRVLEHLEATNGDIPTLTRTTIGGSAVPISMIDTFREKYGVAVLQIWGMTETSPLGVLATETAAVAALPEAERRDELNKQGRIQYGLDVKIITEEGELAPRDGETSGALWVKGPWVTSAYYKREGEELLDADGWFPTGDAATLDEFGYLRITDRTKDVIKSGGEWISSIDLENCAAGHPKVHMAAVIGKYHPKWEERPLMFIVPIEGAQVSKDEVLAHLKQTFAKWQLPEEVLFLDDIPLTATGKIKKTALREQFKDFEFKV